MDCLPRHKKTAIVERCCCKVVAVSGDSTVMFMGTKFIQNFFFWIKSQKLIN